MEKIPVSVVILTFNNAKTIAAAVQSVQRFDQVLAVDSGSSDETLSILKALDVEIIECEWLGYARQRQAAIAYCRHHWVFFLDSDESADPALVDTIAEKIQQTELAALSVPIHEHFMGIPNHAWTKRCHKVRVFRQSKAGIPVFSVHEGVVVRGPVVEVSAVIHHYGEKDIATKLEKIHTYATLSAQDKLQHGQNPSWLRLLTALPLGFIKSYLLRRQCFSGKRGLIAAVHNGYYAFLKQAKLYELKAEVASSKSQANQH